MYIGEGHKVPLLPEVSVSEIHRRQYYTVSGGARHRGGGWRLPIK